MKKGQFALKYTGIIYLILILSIVVAIGMPIFQSQVIYPNFMAQLIDNAKTEAFRTGNHLQQMVLSDQSQGELHISTLMKSELQQATLDYELWKIKVFSKSGETLYSSAPEEIGSINLHQYFHEIVASGKKYSKVVQKNTKSLENQFITRDVMETYIPIMSHGKFIGAFELYYDITSRIDRMEDLVSHYNLILYILSTIIVLIVLLTLASFSKSNKERKQFEKQLFQIAHTDPLTKVYNRRRFEELLQSEINRYLRYRTGGSILLFDIDHFKKVNDTYGHQAGDIVLVELAKTCKENLRSNDIVARYGGEEFIIFTPEINPDQAIKAAERLRQDVESASIETSSGPIKITISLGVAHFKDVEELSIDTVLNHADTAMYLAKESGRNRVVEFLPIQ